MMEAKISKAQLEVWEWKEKAYQEIKDMNFREAMDKLHNDVQETVEQIKKKRRERKNPGSDEKR